MQKQTNISKGLALVIIALLNVIFVRAAFTSDARWYYCLTLSLPLLILVGFAVRRSPGRK